MHATRVPFFDRSGQILLVIISASSCGLSFWLTVRFCASLAPGHAALELLAVGVTWELAKLTFGTLGSQRIKHGVAGGRLWGFLLLGVSLVLAVGSIVASLAFLMQTDQRLSQDARRASQGALHTSATYERDAASLRSLDHEIAALLAAAEQYRAKGLLTQGLRTMQLLAPLRQARQVQAQALSGQEVAMAGAGTGTAENPLFGGSPTCRLLAQCMLAVMLEVVSMIALSLLCASGDGASEGAGGGGGVPGRPALRPRRLRAASPRIGHRAPMHRGASPASLLACNTGYDARLLRPIDAHAASHRTTRHASLHRSASQWMQAARKAEEGARPDASWGAPPRISRQRRDAQGLRTLYAQAKDLVLTMRVRPRYREMQRALGASQHLVQRFLRNMVEEGVLYRCGSSYALVAPSQAHALTTGGEA